MTGGAQAPPKRSGVELFGMFAVTMLIVLGLSIPALRFFLYVGFAGVIGLIVNKVVRARAVRGSPEQPTNPFKT
ncbi:MAG: hypothetical protein M5R36_21820 [Deltaproteobacteria bacterium]|nr:hypothetical protein [Deltaproteobacteria bacterium]